MRTVVSRGVMALALAAGALGLLAAVALPGGRAIAAAGTWGVGQWPYLNGTICTEAGSAADPAGTTTLPLVSWNLDPSLTPAFLATPAESQSGTDTAVPPYVANGATAAALTVGQYGLNSTANIAATAYLIRQWGSDPDPARVAEVSALILEHAGTAVPDECLGGLNGGPSAADAQSLWDQAVALAGPYQIAITPTPAQAILGQPSTITATVTSAAGRPVPGLTVTFSAPGASFAATVATTDATGVAHTTVTLPPTGSLAGTSVSASITTSSGLMLVTNPDPVPAGQPDSGAPSAVALALAPATVTTGTALLTVNGAADPSVHLQMANGLGLVGHAVATTGSVSGLNGHAGNAVISIAGPEPIPHSGSCADISPDQWSSAISTDPSLVVSGSPTTVSGDGTFSGPSFDPAAAGCYAIGGSFATTNASPNVSRTIGYQSALAVLPTTIAVSAGHNGLSGGQITASVVVTGAGGLDGRLAASLIGPVPPQDGSCSGLPTSSWTGAKAAGAFATLPFSRDGTYPLTGLSGGPITRSPGCYAVGFQAQLRDGASGSVSLTGPAGTTGSTVLLLDPAIAVQTTAGWTYTTQAIQASAQISGTLTQSGSLTSTLLWLPPQPLGCSAGDWSQAVTMPGSAVVTVQGDGSYALSAPLASKAGCYSLIGSISLDADASITARSASGAAPSVFLAATLDVPTPLGGPAPGGPGGLSGWTVLIGIGVVLALTAGGTLWLAWSNRRSAAAMPPGPGGPLMPAGLVDPSSPA